VDVNVRQVRPVVNPALAPRTQRWLKRLIYRRAHPHSKLAIEFICPFAAGVCALGALISGFQPLWAGATVVSAVVVVFVRCEIPVGGLRRHRRDFVDSSGLDPECLRALGRTQFAIDSVLVAEVHRTGRIVNGASAKDLQRHEWEIACRLRDITRLRDEYLRAWPAGVPGPQTAAVLNAQLRAITIAQNATTRRVEQLRRYAREVTAAEAALKDWQTAELIARQNDRYRALVAQSAADQHAITEITHLTDQAALSREALQVTLAQATLAAQPLVLS
jgi:hypothetical protein